MTKVAKSTLEEVDLILWLVEPSTYIGEVEKSIIEELKKSKKPIILVINKIDTVSAENLQKFENLLRIKGKRKLLLILRRRLLLRFFLLFRFLFFLRLLLIR